MCLCPISNCNVLYTCTDMSDFTHIYMCVTHIYIMYVTHVYAKYTIYVTHIRTMYITIHYSYIQYIICYSGIDMNNLLCYGF